jgi:hypothetical protein
LKILSCSHNVGFANYFLASLECGLKKTTQGSL